MKKFGLSSSRVLTDQGIVPAAILIENGQISSVCARDQITDEYPVRDFDDRILIPGLVDTHVHINEPGRTEWEGFETATRAAAQGGITTLVDMPLNCDPVTTSAAALRTKLAATEGKLWVDCGFYGGVVPGNTKELPELAKAGVLGCKAFLIHSGLDEFPNVTRSDLEESMPVMAKLGIPLLVHAELCQGAVPTVKDERSYLEYLRSRPRSWENDAIRLMISLCEKYRCPVHIVHLSSSESVPLIREARQRKLPITVETCPHYLVFASEEISAGHTEFKCAPPIRESENREALWAALLRKEIDFIVSDHSPCTPELKATQSGDFSKAWGGIASLQFGLSSIWTEAEKRSIELPQVVKWLSEIPARTFGLKRKGKIAPGYDADIVVWNPEVDYTVRPEGILHRHKLTPYLGRKLKGSVEVTYLRGEKIHEKGEWIEQPTGKTLLNKNHKVEIG